MISLRKSASSIVKFFKANPMKYTEKQLKAAYDAGLSSCMKFYAAAQIVGIYEILYSIKHPLPDNLSLFDARRKPYGLLCSKFIEHGYLLFENNCYLATDKLLSIIDEINNDYIQSFGINHYKRANQFTLKVWAYIQLETNSTLLKP